MAGTVWTDHDEHVQAVEDQEGAPQVRDSVVVLPAVCMYVCSSKAISRVFRVCARVGAESARDGRWLATDPGLPQRNIIPRKRESCSPEPDINLSGPSLVHPCPSSPSSYPLLSFITSFIMFKLARGRPVAAALRAATVRSYTCRAIGPRPYC